MTLKKVAEAGFTAEIISVGNELLIGHTLDTNSHWIAGHLERTGWRLERVTQLPDSLDAIRSEVQESVRRKPRVVITLGGLGPTHDDITLHGIALALRRPIQLNDEALGLVKERYRKLEIKPKLTVYRRKMAMLPRDAKPLANPVGTAPGVMIRLGGTMIFSLPGVPSEMKAIFKRSILPFIQQLHSKRPVEVQARIVGVIESALAPILEEARREFPGLYLKSHPRGRETGTRPMILLHIYNVEEGSEGKVGQALDYVVEKLARLGW